VSTTDDLVKTGRLVTTFHPARIRFGKLSARLLPGIFDIVLPGIRERRLPRILDGIANGQSAGSLYDLNPKHLPGILSESRPRVGRRTGLRREWLPGIRAVLPRIRERIPRRSPRAELPGIFVTVLPRVLEKAAPKHGSRGVALGTGARPAQRPLGNRPRGRRERHADQHGKCDSTSGHDIVPSPILPLCVRTPPKSTAG
jgi:hypothetical protein